MGPAAGISFAVLRINRATLRLDPRVGPPSVSLPPASPSSLFSLVTVRFSSAPLDLSINLLLSSLYRASNTDVRDSSLLHRRCLRIRRRRYGRRRHATLVRPTHTYSRFREKFARYRELLRQVDINLSPEERLLPLALFPFLFPFRFVPRELA